MLSSFPGPVVIAHRGASSHAPENTLASFRLAVEQGARAIELDVQLTADQEVVVFHDTFLDRTTNGTGKVSDLTLRKLKHLNAAVGFIPAYQEESIPTLNEVFNELPPNILINIELKNLSSPLDALPEKTAALIVEHQAQGRTLISSFNPTALTRFSKILPGVACGRLLFNKLLIAYYRASARTTEKYYSIHLPYQSLTARLVQAFKERELRVYTFTLNHPEEIMSALKMGVDGFFTDDPAFALRTIDLYN